MSLKNNGNNGHPLKTTKKQRGGVTGKGFMPGKSGNPGGRPKVLSEARDAVKEWLEGKCRGKTRFYLALELLLLNDPKQLLFFAYGKPVETHEISGRQGESLIDPVLLATAQELAKRL